MLHIILNQKLPSWSRHFLSWAKHMSVMLTTIYWLWSTVKYLRYAIEGFCLLKFLLLILKTYLGYEYKYCSNICKNDILGKHWNAQQYRDNYSIDYSFLQNIIKPLKRCRSTWEFITKIHQIIHKSYVYLCVVCFSLGSGLEGDFIFYIPLPLFAFVMRRYSCFYK